MKHSFAYFVCVVVGTFFGSWNAAPARPPASLVQAKTQEPDTAATKSMADRFARLESRFESLERVVFATAKISAIEAERRLKQAEEQLRESRQLFLKGFIAEGRWRQDEFSVDLLRRELEFLKTTSKQRKSVIEIEVLQAEKDLQLAEEQLNYTQNLATRGFASVDQVRENERFVSDSKSRLDLARDKLKAAEELEAIANDKPPEPPSKELPPTPKK
jgi:hypothetical protein